VYPFKRLNVWVKAHELTLLVFRLTEGASGRRYPGLVNQLRRAVATIPANIAEGAGHSTDPQLNRFLEVAMASAHEADYHLLLAKELEILTARDHAKLEARVTEVRQMLSGLRKKVLERIRSTPPARARRNRATVGGETSGAKRKETEQGEGHRASPLPPVS
jgi:four helix bundle protein